MPEDTHPPTGEPIEVGVRSLRAELRRWIETARRRDVVITDRGRPVARLVPLGEQPGLDRLVARGLVSPPDEPVSPVERSDQVRSKAPVSDLVPDQRR